MAKERVERRLAAILAADVVGYSRLMERDEQGTLDALRKAREIVAQAVASHEGRVFGGAGDSVIAEFGSAVEATQAAIAIQKELVGWKSSGAIESDFRFRIGLNLGDVVVEGDNLLGDGVNVAARIEALAEPGGICMSHAVFEQVRGKIDIPIERLGQYKLKNIARRISVYRVALDSKVRPAHTRWLAEVRRRRWLLSYLIGTRHDADCNIGYYPVGIENFLDEAERLNRPIMLHIGESDPYTPPEARAQLATALGSNALATIHCYPDIGHAFARPGAPSHVPQAADLANERSAAFFRKHLA